MDKNLQMQLEMETEKAFKYSAAWKEVIEPYFVDKGEEIYRAFIDCPTSDTKKLELIKLQHNVLMSMKDHIKHYITTGKLAQQTLKENSDGE